MHTLNFFSARARTPVFSVKYEFNVFQNEKSGIPERRYSGIANHNDSIPQFMETPDYAICIGSNMVSGWPSYILHSPYAQIRNSEGM